MQQFPKSAQGWRNSRLEIRVAAIPPVGTTDYSRIVRAVGESRPIAVLTALMDAFPAHFTKAEASLAPDVWRLAYHHPTIWLPRLADPTFCAASELTSAHYREWLSEIPPNWLGATRPTEEALADLRLGIDKCGLDGAKAVWATLSTLKWLGLPRNTVRDVWWWDIRWLKGLVDHAIDDEPPI